MSAVNARLSKLRGLLHEGPTRWTLICDLLVSWPAHDGLDVALEYAELHAQRWPADVRKAPARWWHELGQALWYALHMESCSNSPGWLL